MPIPNWLPSSSKCFSFFCVPTVFSPPCAKTFLLAAAQNGAENHKRYRSLPGRILLERNIVHISIFHSPFFVFCLIFILQCTSRAVADHVPFIQSTSASLFLFHLPRFAWADERVLSWWATHSGPCSHRLDWRLGGDGEVFILLYLFPSLSGCRAGLRFQSCGTFFKFLPPFSM